MRILVVNPNTTHSMTEKIGAAARAAAAPGTEIIATQPDAGPVSIEGYYDEAFCVPGLIGEVRKGLAGGIDGVVIACFDDPGLGACRAFAPVPVVGICEGAMRAASMVAHTFSVVTTLSRTVPLIEHLALRYGMERHCRRVRAADVPVLALEDPNSQATEKVRAEVGRAFAEDRAEAVLLGCAGMADLTSRLSDEFGAPVIDGVAAAVKMVEALVGLGLTSSKIGGYSAPRAKPYVGRFKTEAVAA